MLNELNELKEFYQDTGPERVGFILTNGAIVEVENVSGTPEEGFDVCPEDLITFAMKAVASWHTHPGASANLSMHDDSAFKSWPSLDHYIIGADGIRKFLVYNDRVLNA